MFSAIARVFKTPDLRRKILFTLAMVAIYRLGTVIPGPFVNYPNVQQCLASGSSTAGFQDMINLFSGGALLQLSIFALGVMPYITASIITQLLRVVIPHFEALHKEGQTGQAKLTQYTRYMTIGLAILQATTLVTVARSGSLFAGSTNPACQSIVDMLPASEPGAEFVNIIRMVLMIAALTAGTTVIMWLGEMITERGIGNGMSLLIFTSISATFPSAIGAMAQGESGLLTLVLIIFIGLLIMMGVVFVEQSQRRIPVQYAKRMVGRRTYGGNSTYIPIKVNQAGVIPVIFASSLLYLPMLVAQFNQTPDPVTGELPGWVTWITNNFTTGDHPLYMAVYFLLVIGFAYFYVAIAFNPEEVAENMRKHGGFVPGIRAGRPTADYLNYVLTRITFPGSMYLGILALIPLIALATVNANQNFPFGGASMLIIVGVGLETVKQIDAQLQQRNYEGLLR
ncbi:MAG: preprotein translocase subunit SecY [Pseudoclavibacter sp.]